MWLLLTTAILSVIFKLLLMTLKFMTWKRPDIVPYPTVWGTFKGKPYGDQKPLEYKVQDLTEDYVDGAIKHMCQYFLIRENTCSSTGFLEEEDSVNDILELWRLVLKQRMGLICLVTDPETGKEKIAGVNMTCINTKDEKTDKTFKGKLMNRIWTCLSDLQSNVDVFEKYNTDVYLGALGLSVAPQYHGDGVGYQLLKARTPLCKATGIPLTVTAFTGAASKHLADKSDFHLLTELNCGVYKQDGKLAYPKLSDTVIALMAKEIKTK